MAGLASKLGRKNEGAIVALLAQRNLEEAARVTGLGANGYGSSFLDPPEF